MPVRGFVDGFDGSFLSGWAFDTNDARTCLVKVLADDGRELGRGRASHPRGDLNAIAGGRNIAFRIAVKCPPDIQMLSVTADGVPLVGSPVVMQRGVFDGGFTVEQGYIRGTVVERFFGSDPPRLRFEDQYRRVVAEGLGAVTVDKASVAPTIFRFDLPLNPKCFGYDELALVGYANDVAFGRAQCAARLQGYLDELNDSSIQGWLLSPDAPYAHFEIDVFRDGKKIGEGPCEITRDDLKSLHPQSYKAGFNIPIKPPSLIDGTAAEISIKLHDSQIELFGGPFVLSERADAIAAAQRVASIVRMDERLSRYEFQVIQQALVEYIDKRRRGPGLARESADTQFHDNRVEVRFNIVIPIYRGLELTRSCIESVLKTRNANFDSIILVNDCSPEGDMEQMLQEFAAVPQVYILKNAVNLGFVGSVNRALAFCRLGHVVLLNSDTRVFSGIWDEFARVLTLDRGIGTATALSSNATIFSYPHPALVTGYPLSDVTWEELSQIALVENEGLVVDVPTGHGFCMLIRRAVLDQIGRLDERFGRGYGEENDFCQKAADRGWRNVAACAVLVAHEESISFQAEKPKLLPKNLALLEALYPEYTSAVMRFERTDPLRRARWRLDLTRLKLAVQGGVRFALVIENWLEGGTKKAIADIENALGYEGRARITLSSRADGSRELNATSPLIRAIFAPDEDDFLFDILQEGQVDLVLVHQLLGYEARFVEKLASWGKSRRMKFYIHDFYTLCPRVTMIDAIGRFCEAADAETCRRCVAMGGSHEASRLSAITPAKHRSIFSSFLGSCVEVVAPSTDTVQWAQRIFPDLTIKAEPHPEKTLSVPLSIRDGDPNQIIVLGAIGPHKGSRRLLELAREACLAEPLLKFHVIGYTDIDKELRALGNVKITGRYKQEELNSLVERTGGRYAIFPYLWPETFSYTLSEALRLMIWPIVPRLGAPAERVEQLQFGSILESMTLEALTEELRRLQCKADRDSSMTRVQSATVSNYAL